VLAAIVLLEPRQGDPQRQRIRRSHPKDSLASAAQGSSSNPWQVRAEVIQGMDSRAGSRL
jgi:hypothetical protein